MSARRPLLLLPLLLLSWLPGCARESRNLPVGSPRPAISGEEFERRIAVIEGLVASGREQAALERIAASIEDWPPEPLRRRLQRIGYELRRNRFYRKHPLHFSLDVDRPRAAFGETLLVRLKITNLGAGRITFPRRYRSWLDALLFRPAEESVLQLRLTTSDADGLGSRWGSERMLLIPLDADLLLAAGGSRIIEVPLVLDGGGRSRFRLLQIGAIYRPIAVLGADGERRYDPFEFPSTSVRIFQAAQQRWSEGGLDLIEACLEGESTLRPEALFVAAVGLDADHLAGGIERLVRAAPSLEPRRRRSSMAALQILTGHRFADDPVRFVGWWESKGRHLNRQDRVRAAGLQNQDNAGRLWVGGSD